MDFQELLLMSYMLHRARMSICLNVTEQDEFKV